MSDTIKRLAKLHKDACSCQDEFQRAKTEIEAESDFPEALQTLNALADQHRLTIVRLVQRYGELCSCEIESAFDLAHSTMIHHLGSLTKADVLVTRKKGKWSYYKLSESLSAQLQHIASYLKVTKDDGAMVCCCMAAGSKGRDRKNKSPR